MKTVPWRFQSSFREALPERIRKEVERSAQRRSEDAQRALRRPSEAAAAAAASRRRRRRPPAAAVADSIYVYIYTWVGRGRHYS